MDDRPVVHCILAIRYADGEYRVRAGEPVTLDDALDFVRLGYEVIPDPFDLELLTRWEQLRRPKRWNNW